MNERNLNAIPIAACRMAFGEVEFRDNGPQSKSAAIKLKARSGGSIDHWYWGKVVHDLAGMRTHKPRLPVDYAHNDSEILGYLNHFDSASGDLIASGALTPWREDDRASEVIFKMREGVPYEASIFFGGDGIKVQEVAEGQVEQVNGRQFEGPGVIIREWPLRGVAICPYGADSNTESVALAASETITATQWKAIEQQKETKMEAKEEAVEAKTDAESAPVAPVEAPAVEAEVKPSEVTEAMAAQPHATEKTAVDAGANVAALTAERDGLVAALAVATGDIEEMRKQLDAEKLARTDAERKLAAIVAGQPPISAAPAEGVKAGSWMERARINKKG
jgi:hypothetical protein